MRVVAQKPWRNLPMGKHFLYSTNVYLKLLIQEQYAKGKHWVWCSEEFNARNAASHTMSTLVAPSSNPCEIFRELTRDLKEGRDFHSDKINKQKLSLAARAHEWLASGEIDADQRDEILFMVDHAERDHWKPLLYVIPRAHIDPARIKLVPMKDRASFGPEFIIKDLRREEFELIDFDLHL